ncbi:hypothetical protein Lal_00024945 [Lupinus albus]|nr:hypothetical protein Lal_00024945 [Lupinus albus]
MKLSLLMPFPSTTTKDKYGNDPIDSNDNDPIDNDSNEIPVHNNEDKYRKKYQQRSKLIRQVQLSPPEVSAHIHEPNSYESNLDELPIALKKGKR